MSTEVVILIVVFALSVIFTLSVVYFLTRQMTKSIEVFNLIFKDHGDTRVAQAESLEKAMERQSEQSSDLFRLMIKGLISLETERSRLLAEIDSRDIELGNQLAESRYKKENPIKFSSQQGAVPESIAREGAGTNGFSPDVFPLPRKDPPQKSKDIRKNLASNE